MVGNSPTGDPGSLYCGNCQSPLPPTSSFCPNCGAARPISANPLGPKTLGGILGGIFQIYGAGFLGIVIIVAVVQIPLSLLGFWIEALVQSAIFETLVYYPSDFSPQLFDPLRDPPFDPSLFDFAEIIEALLPVIYFGVTLLIATWLTSVIMAGALIYGVSGQILGRPIPVGPAYSFALGRYMAMLGASLLADLGVLLMAITIIGIPFAIFFGVRWFFVYQTASLERYGPQAALARSSDLVRDNWWRVFGILLLIGISMAIANGIASAILGLIPYIGPLGLIPYIGPIVVAVLFAPVLILAQTLLYHDLRVRRDRLAGYDPEVLASELESTRGL